MVLFLSTFGELFELHLCEFIEATPYGMGCVCPKIPIFLHLFDIELSGAGDSLLVNGSFGALTLPPSFHERYVYYLISNSQLKLCISLHYNNQE